MSVLLETSKGDLVVDLYTDDCPAACKNFLKLCKMKYYNNCMFHLVIRDFIVQTGDPTGTGTGGESINGTLYGDQARFFEDEIRPHLRHKKKGIVGMAGGGKNMNASQFYITTAAELDSLDDKHTIFGEVTEGFDVLEAINVAFVDALNRPLQNTRIRHTLVLEDPFPDPPQLADHVPEDSPPPTFATEGDRLEDDWVPMEDTRDAAIIEEEARKQEAEKRAEVLEMVGDLPTADAKPPSDMVFVCKLNPVTTEEDLEIIFSRFGKITSCDIIRDWKTGESLCYAFIGFDSEKAAENAFFKMDNVLIDDRRIHVDFSQSMHHLWRQFKTFGKAGSAALGAEADGIKPGGKKGRGGPGGAGQIELKTSAGRGLYAGPAASGRGGYAMVHDEGAGPSGRKERPKEGEERLGERKRSREDRHHGREEPHRLMRDEDRRNGGREDGRQERASGSGRDREPQHQEEEHGHRGDERYRRDERTEEKRSRRSESPAERHRASKKDKKEKKDRRKEDHKHKRRRS